MYLAPFIKTARVYLEKVAQELPPEPSTSEYWRVAGPAIVGGLGGGVGGAAGGYIMGDRAGQALSSRIWDPGIKSKAGPGRAIAAGIIEGALPMAASAAGLLGGAHTGVGAGEIATRAMLSPEKELGVQYHNLGGVLEDAEKYPEEYDSVYPVENIRADQQDILEKWIELKRARGG